MILVKKAGMVDSEDVAVIKIWDVGHGSAIYVETYDKNVIIDLGATTDFSPIRWLNNKYGVDYIDYLIVTHPDKDHIDDILAIGELGIKVGCFIRPDRVAKLVKEAALFEATKEDLLNDYDEYDARYPKTTSICKYLTKARNCSLATFYAGEDNDSVNNHSIVSVVNLFGVKFLIPGDNEALSWNRLLAGKDFTNAISGAEYLVAAHHGRASGYCEELFKHITPKLIFASDKDGVETTYTAEYRKKATGKEVTIWGKPWKKARNVLTTRKDGRIHIDVLNASCLGNVEVKVKVGNYQ